MTLTDMSKWVYISSAVKIRLKTKGIKGKERCGKQSNKNSSRVDLIIKSCESKRKEQNLGFPGFDDFENHTNILVCFMSDDSLGQEKNHRAFSPLLFLDRCFAQTQFYCIPTARVV